MVTKKNSGGPLKLLFHTDIPYVLTEEERAALRSVCPAIEIIQGYPDAALARSALAEADIIVTDQKLPPTLGDAPRLQWVQLVSAGANQLLNHPLADTSIPVTTASGLHGVPIAQFVTGALLMLVHQFPQLAAIQASRRWPEGRWAFRGSLIRGQTAGVIGYGSIGRECARQLHALGMTILALDPGSKRDDGYNVWPGTGDAEGLLPKQWFQPTEIKAMLPHCDVVVVAAPFTPQTAGMIGSAELAVTKRGVRFVIISRGGIVEEVALAQALTEGQVAGAAVDCFVQEPPPSDHPLYAAPNVILTPHMAGAFEGFWPAFIRLVTENVRRFNAGLPLLNQANKRLGY